MVRSCRCRSWHDLSAGDIEGDAGDPRGGGRGEEEGGGGDVLGLADAAEWERGAQLAALRFGDPVRIRSFSIAEGAMQLMRMRWSTAVSGFWYPTGSPGLLVSLVPPVLR
jgi:hypothetical protein